MFTLSSGYQSVTKCWYLLQTYVNMILDSENIKPFLDCELPLVGMVVPTAKYTVESTFLVSPDGTPLYVAGEESLLV